MFLKTSEELAKIVECILFCLNMVCKTQRNPIYPFLTRNIERPLCTSGFNVKFLKSIWWSFVFFSQIPKEHSKVWW